MFLLKLYPSGYPYAYGPSVHPQYILVFRKPADKPAELQREGGCQYQSNSTPKPRLLQHP